MSKHERKASDLLKGWLTIASGCLLLSTFMVLAVRFGVLPGPFGGAVGNAVWPVFIALSILLVIRGRKMMAADAETLLERDKRLPVIYLRPFSEDRTFARHKGWARLLSRQRIRLRGATPATYEEEVARALGKVGPFVAIGNPKETLPELGAARMYVDDSEWQEKVKELITRAGLVFMQIGESDGFLWELDQVVKSVKPEQLILGLPSASKRGEAARQAQYDHFRSRSLSSFASPLPEKMGAAQFLYFGEGWSPHTLEPYKSSRILQPSIGHSGGHTLQQMALKELHAEFMLVSTPYWLRYYSLMAIMMVVWVVAVFVILRLLTRS